MHQALIDPGRPQLRGPGFREQRRPRLVAVLAALAAGAWAAPAVPAEPEPAPIVTGAMVPTDGMLTPNAVRRLRPHPVPQRPAPRPRTGQSTSVDWLSDYLSRLLDREPAVVRRRRAPSHAATTTKPPHAIAPLALAAPLPSHSTRTGPPANSAVTKSVVANPAVTNPVITGTLATADPTASVDQLIIAAERSQLRTDLVKLEFTSRTYDEQRLAGQLAFRERDDWRVLERARDAMGDAERASAISAGFEANTYINDISRTIVVAVAGTQDLRRDFLAADIWRALIVAEAPQHFYLAKTYVRSVIQRYQSQGYSTECVGHSLGGGACAYAAAELGIRAIVLNPISAGKLAPSARLLVTNYVVDGDIANLVYRARGNAFPGDTTVINDGRDTIRLMALEKYGQLAGPILVVRELRASVDSHKADHALDLIAAQAESTRPK